MYLNYLDFFSIFISGDKGIVWNYLNKEYGGVISEGKNNQNIINLTLKKLRVSSDLYQVRPPVSYSADQVFISDKNNNKLFIDYSKLGQDGCNMICEPDFNPNFFSIVIDFIASVYALKANSFFCHSAAFKYKDATILMPAFRGAGKTTTLIEAVDIGAKYISDDWVRICGNGELQRIPKNILLMHYDIEKNKMLENFLSDCDRAAFSLVSELEKDKFDLYSDQVMDVKDIARVRLSPHNLFGKSNVIESADIIDYVCWLEKTHSNNQEEVKISDSNLEQLVSKVQNTIYLEHTPFFLAYSVHVSRGLPRNQLIDDMPNIVKQIAAKAFSDAKIISLNRGNNDIEITLNSILM